MKKKLVSVLLAMALLSNSSIIFAEEPVVNDNAIESSSSKEETVVNGEKDVDQTSNINETPEKEEVNQVADEPSDIESSEIPQSANNEKVSVIRGDQFVLKINSKYYTMNGKTRQLSAPPLIVAGRTYLPMRFITDRVLGTQLSWNQTTKAAIISKDDVTLKATVGSKYGSVNGKSVFYSAAPLVKDGVTYLPMNYLKDYFDINATYVGSSKITITGKDKGINHKPIASFNFSQSSYVAGQKVDATSTSYDPDGHKLTQKEWCLVQDGLAISDKEFSQVFNQSKEGTYKIGLRVKDEYGLWSDWVHKDLVIEPNRAPQITYLGTEQESYAQGEAITYKYYYDNESWEKITSEKWTYRHADEDVSKAILGKPDALFTAGDYIISLQLEDSYGNKSEVSEAKIHITTQVLMKELSYRFTRGKVGDIIDNYQGFNYRDYEDAIIDSTSLEAGTLLMSDSPEQVEREGILYRDAMNGKGRILLHHFNKFSDDSVSWGPKRLVLVAENTSSQNVKVVLQNKTIKGPVSDILYLGQRVLHDYLAGSPDEVFYLKPGEKRYIYDSKTSWKQGTCISGLIDVITNGEVTFKVAAVSAGSNVNTLDNMELFMPDIHSRGTFSTIAINHTLNLDSSKPTKILLGGSSDEWVKGYDAITKDAAQNPGNYGVSYYVTVTATEDMGVILNPRADVFKGAVEWKGEGVYNVPSAGPIYSNTAKAVMLGTIKAGQTKTFEYMLPNGSSAPVLIGFIPKSYWDN